jgi:hypothetical protein
MLLMELDYARQIDIDKVVSRHHQKVIFYIKIVHAIAQRVGTAYVIIERLIAEILVVGDSQTLEEAFPCLEIVAQVEGVARSLAA